MAEFTATARSVTVVLCATLVPLAPSLAQESRVEGTVSNALTGAPVARAQVLFVGTGRPVSTNENGYYVLEALSPGTYDIRVEAPGFHPALYSAYRVSPGEPTRFFFHLQPTDAGGQRPMHEQAFAIQPGIGLGGSVGMDGIGGPSNGPIGAGAGFEMYVRAATRSGLLIRGGAHFGEHPVNRTTQPYRLSAVFVEPMFVALDLSSRWAPFVGGRFARVREHVGAPTVSLSASGHTLGAGAGVFVRLAPQVALESGVMLGVATFGAFTFQGELAWRDCLDTLADGTVLPESVVRCTAARSFGGAVILCYPPYYPETTSSCSPPKIPYAGTERNATWMRLWFGLSLSLASPRPGGG